jgi:hypothetical protein
MVRALGLGFVAMTLLAALLIWVNARTLLGAARLARAIDQAELPDPEPGN